MQNVSKANWLRLMILGIIWGGSFMGVEVALEGFAPLMLAATRITMAAIILQIVARVKGSGMIRLSQHNGLLIWLCALIIALMSNAVPFALLSWGQGYVASGFAGVCMAVVPLIVLPLAHFFVPGETMHTRRVIGFLIGTAGVIVLIGPDAFSSTGADAETLARLACVAAAGCYAVGSITTRLCPEVNFYALSAAVMTLAALILMPIAIWVEGGFPSDLGLRPLLAIVYLGVLPTALAQLLVVQVNRQAGPPFLSLVNYQIPIWSVILGAVFLAEPVPASLFAALGMILFGLSLSQLNVLKRLFKRSG